jgi:thiamine-phosphate pyrophosphorylase
MLRYAITDRTRAALDRASQIDALLGQAERLAAADVNFIQLREKDLEAAELVDLTRKLLGVLRSHPRPPRLLINSRADVAMAAGADGVHLTSAPDALTPRQVRRAFASAGLPAPTVSVSCHTMAETVQARESGADLILFGPVFEKVVSGAPAPDLSLSEGVGLNLLRTACTAAAPVPVLALGGVTETNAQACLDAGAAGIAAIRLFL